MTLTERLLEVLDEALRAERIYPKLRERLTMIRGQVDLASTPAPTIFARIEMAQIECPNCHFLMEVLRGRRGPLKGWDRRGRILACPQCSRAYTPAVVLYPRLFQGGPGTHALDIPPDHLAGAAIRAQQIQLGYLRPERRWKRQHTNVVMAEGCLCTPGEWRTGSNPQCPRHGKLTT